MEDRYLLEENFLDYAREKGGVRNVSDLLPTLLFPTIPSVMSFFGVFDGHGGSNAVNFISKSTAVRFWRY